MSEYPASLTVHWPSGPVNCCASHAEKLVATGNFLGYHVGVTEAPQDSVCTNCENEAKKS